jgi:hypothetical protein
MAYGDVYQHNDVQNMSRNTMSRGSTSNENNPLSL